MVFFEVNDTTIRQVLQDKVLVLDCGLLSGNLRELAAPLGCCGFQWKTWCHPWNWWQCVEFPPRNVDGKRISFDSKTHDVATTSTSSWGVPKKPPRHRNFKAPAQRPLAVHLVTRTITGRCSALLSFVLQFFGNRLYNSIYFDDIICSIWFTTYTKFVICLDFSDPSCI